MTSSKRLVAAVRMVATLVMVAGATAVFGSFRGLVWSTVHAQVTLPAATPTVAVVPFSNSSGTAADSWIGPALAETVAADLKRRFDVALTSRDAISDVVPAAGGGDGTDELAAVGLGRQLRATWLVVGGYERTGELLQVTARLVDVSAGTIVRTVRVDGEIGKFFVVPEQIVTRLSEGTPLSKGTAVAQNQRPSVASPPGERPQPAAGILTVGAAAPPPFGERPTVDAPRTATPPVIDGRLDDATWKEAVRITKFVQRNPVEGAPATEDTEVYIAFDSANVYLAIYAHYSDTELIRANRSDRDQLERDDTIAVYFDPFMDQQRAYVFQVNGYGVQGDSIAGGGTGGGGGGFGGGGGGGGGGVPRGDASWDALFSSAGALVADGWTAELTIPLKSLRYPARSSGEAHRWGFQVARSIQSKNETVVWAPVTRAISGFLTQMGTLQGLTNLSTSRNLELLPTFTAVQLGLLDKTRAAFREEDFRPEGGFNVKYGVTSELTADFTFNPDFSQIESDQPQIQVNQRFPLFFSELRPFFLEGQEIFSTRGNINLVHTRTIIDPRGGGKVSGKVGPVTVGVLVANDEAPGKLDDESDPAFGQSAKFFIGRVRYDLYPGSYVGGIVTDREFVGAYSRVGGVDGRFRLGRTNDLEFRAAQSFTRGDDGQELSGPTVDLGFRHSGRHLELDIRHDSTDPGFRTATGFVRRTDTRRTGSGVQYRWWPQGWLTNWGPSLDYSRNYDFGGILQDEGIGAGVNFQFARNIRLNVEGSREMERYLGVDFWKSRRQLFAAVNTSRRVTVGGNVNWGDQISFTANPFLGSSRGGRLFLTVLPFSRLQSSLNVNFSRLLDPRNNDREVFDVKIFRSQTSYQFSERLLLRSILEYNTFNRTFDANLLLAYRVNSGTVFFAGYDDHYQQGDRIDATIFPGSALERTNRAFFTKFSYLFRY